MRMLVAGLCGVVFGAGLAVCGLTNPAKVQAFLDVAGAWDPTLAVVMAGALGVSAAGFAWARRRPRPWLADRFAWPVKTALDPQLLAGSALFGVGWGLVGMCPGPALANLWRFSPDLWIFVASMLAGALAHRLATRPRPAAGLAEPRQTT